MVLVEPVAQTTGSALFGAGEPPIATTAKRTAEETHRVNYGKHDCLRAPQPREASPRGRLPATPGLQRSSHYAAAWLIRRGTRTA